MDTDPVRTLTALADDHVLQMRQLHSRLDAQARTVSVQAHRLEQLEAELRRVAPELQTTSWSRGPVRHSTSHAPRTRGLSPTSLIRPEPPQPVLEAPEDGAPVPAGAASTDLQDGTPPVLADPIPAEPRQAPVEQDVQTGAVTQDGMVRSDRIAPRRPRTTSAAVRRRLVHGLASLVGTPGSGRHST